MKPNALFLLLILILGCGPVIVSNNTAESSDDGAEPKMPIPDLSGNSETEGDTGLDGNDTASPADIVGDWRSDGCADRKYTRKMKFFENGIFTGVDEVSPCPPRASCVWSGIIRWAGDWTLAGDVIKLVKKEMPKNKGGGPGADTFSQPDELRVLEKSPVVIGEEKEGEMCPYKKQ